MAAIAKPNKFHRSRKAFIVSILSYLIIYTEQINRYNISYFVISLMISNNLYI